MEEERLERERVAEQGNVDTEENGEEGGSEDSVDGREENDSDKDCSEQEEEEEVENESEDVREEENGYNVELRVIVEDVDTDDSLVPVLDDHDEAERKLLD